MEDVEKQAVVARGRGDVARAERKALRGAEVGRVLESILSVLGAAIVSLVEEWRVDEG